GMIWNATRRTVPGARNFDGIARGELREIRSGRAVTATSTATAGHFLWSTRTTRAQTESAFINASRVTFTPRPTGPEKKAIAREGRDRAADDAAVSRDGAGLVTADVLTVPLSGGESAGARETERPRRIRLD